jgi:ribosomal protein L16/L10AE
MSRRLSNTSFTVASRLHERFMDDESLTKRIALRVRPEAVLTKCRADTRPGQGRGPSQSQK